MKRRLSYSEEYAKAVHGFSPDGRVMRRLEWLPKAQELKSQGLTGYEIANILGKNPVTIYSALQGDWNGKLGRHRRWSLEEAIELKSQGLTATEIAKRIGVCISTVTKALPGDWSGLTSKAPWRDEASKMREAGMSINQIAEVVGVSRQRIAQIFPGRIKLRGEPRVPCHNPSCNKTIRACDLRKGRRYCGWDCHKQHLDSREGRSDISIP